MPMNSVIVDANNDGIGGNVDVGALSKTAEIDEAVFMRAQRRDPKHK